MICSVWRFQNILRAKETWLLGQQTKVVSGGEITVSSLYSGFSTAGE